MDAPTPDDAPHAMHDDAPRAMHDDAPRAMHDDAPRAMHDDAPRAMHDLGGAPRFRCTAVEPDDDAPPNEFDKRVDAVRSVLRDRGLFTVDEMRLNIERLHETEYFGLTYYEKWLRSITAVMVAKGIVTWEDLA